LFYLKGVAPPEVSTQQIYKGIVPFIVIQLIFIGVVIAYPEFIYMLFGKS
jgi:TRAP-type mannitol/chloroaromatic compound transport system permease large subunit